MGKPILVIGGSVPVEIRQIVEAEGILIISSEQGIHKIEKGYDRVAELAAVLEKAPLQVQGPRFGEVKVRRKRGGRDFDAKGRRRR